MLSTKQARQLLGARSQDLPDREMERLCSDLAELARIALTTPRSPSNATFSGLRKQLPHAASEAIEERAAIMEFDGDLDRDTAERAALWDSLQSIEPEDGN